MMNLHKLTIFTAKNFNAGDFVCEYPSEVQEKEDPDVTEQMIAELGLGCYYLDATYGGKKYKDKRIFG